VPEAAGIRSEHAAGSSRVEGENSGYGTVSAVDVGTGKIAWQDEFDEGLVGGSASTAGGITFVGEGNGDFDALETRSGKRLWQFQTGAGVNAAPIAFQIGGQEYVAVASGGNQQLGTPSGDAIFVFRLGE
jgi:glucose dehydrogenase